MIDYLGILTQPMKAQSLPAAPFAFSFAHTRDYTGDNTLDLHAVYDPVNAQLFVTDDKQLLEQLNTTTVTELASPNLKLKALLPLGTRSIAKPWGHEVWYTGIEARGVCDINEIPLPHALHALQLLGLDEGEQPILLKILAPHEDAVLGDLYFELHEHKQEVYVVTDVAESAWPGGTGKLKYGFSAERAATFQSEQAFKDAFLTATLAYETTRNKIDMLLDEAKAQQGLQDPLPVAVLKKLQQTLPPELIAEEQDKRAEMERFTQLIDVRVGDVLKVEKLVPHSLQHGVRVVEFQTPHYERYILSFAQKVVTQDHWDTREALTKVNMNPAAVIQPADQKTIVSFAEFSVDRITLLPGQTQTLSADTYCLLIGVEGTVSCGEQTIHKEQGYYLSHIAGQIELTNRGHTSASVLSAQPNQR